jgi:signal transduction histidine kinase
VTLRVHNEGAPIPPDVLPTLFQPMTRGVSVGGQQRSVGLGLFIVDHLVRAHGGEVKVTSAEAGTTFTVRLPRKRSAPEARE